MVLTVSASFRYADPSSESGRVGKRGLCGKIGSGGSIYSLGVGWGCGLVKVGVGGGDGTWRREEEEEEEGACSVGSTLIRDFLAMYTSPRT